MCDPVSAGFILTGISAGSSIASGYQQNQMASYQAKQANADAQAQKDAGEIEAEKIRDRAKRIAATARANLAASGISIDSPTANLINKDLIERGELDASTAVNNADDAASRLRQRAEALKLEGQGAIYQGYAGAAKSAISTYGKSKGWYGSAANA